MKRIAGVVLGTVFAVVAGQAETPGVLWRASFDGVGLSLAHWHGRIGKKVPLHGAVTEEGRRAEHINIVYDAAGDNHDYWRVKGFEPVALTETTAVRLTVKSTSSVRLMANFRLKQGKWNGVIGGPRTKGSGGWETIEFRDLLDRARRTVRGVVGQGSLPEGADAGGLVLDVIAVDLLAAGKITDVYVDEVVLVDAAAYNPDADVASLPFRVAWASRAQRTPVVDGTLTPGDGWGSTPAVDGFGSLPQGGPVAHTEARVLYDEQALYIGMRLDGPAGAALQTTARDRDGAIWVDDSVEIFIAPPGSAVLAASPAGSRYFHLGVNAIGTLADAVGQEGASWHGEWSAATSQRADGWDVEVRIPFAALGVAGPPNQVWALNLCRTYSTDKGAAHASWSPLARWFHEPEHFGRIAFGEGAPDPAVLSSIVLREELYTRLGAPRAGLVRARGGLAGIADSASGKGASLGRIAGLAGRVAKLAERIAALAPEAVIAARKPIGAELEALLREVQAAELAAEVVKLGASTPAEWPFIVLSGPAITNERFEPGKPLPPSFGVADGLAVAACRGEYEPATFVLYATQDRREVRVAATPLSGPGGVIGTSAVDLRVVKYWFQAGDSGYATKHRLTGGVLVPELLLKDDGLVVVDRKAKRNYMRTGSGLVDISAPAIEFDAKGRPIVAAPKLLGLAPRDAEQLQPFDVPAGEIKQVLVTVHVPADAAPGRYSGEIRVEAAGASAISLPLTLQVRPFDLAPPEVEYSIYIRGRLVDGTPRIPVWSERKSRTQYRAELSNMLAHGVDNPMVLEDRMDRFAEVMAMREAVGMPKRDVYNVGLRFSREMLDAPDEVRKFQERVKPFVKWAKENGYGALYAYAFDEADDLLLKERPMMEAMHAAGGKVFVAVGQQGVFFERAGDLLDLPIMAGPPKREMAERVHGAGHRIAVYANPQVGWEQPLTYRRNYGIALWQTGYDVVMDYVYQHSFGHVWNDFDHAEHKDHNFAYPTVDGVIDTLSWEGFREAVDDVRYASTLMRAVRKAESDPARRERALAAGKWLRSVDTQGDLDQLRRQIADKIAELTR